MRTKKAVFRADASTEIGGGHVSRCLSLATGLGKAGWDCSFLTRSETLSVVPGLGRSDFRIVRLDPETHDDPESAHYADLEVGDLVVIDHYGLDARYEEALQHRGLLVLAIDDRPLRRHAADFLLDQTFGRRPVDYEGLVSRDTLCLLGTDYALLRAEFAQAREQALARRSAAQTVKRVLVSLGATDPKGLSRLVMKALAQTDSDLEIDLVIGSGAAHLTELRAIAQALGKACELHVDTTSMADLLTQADLAIGAAGVSAWERCCMGLPSALIVVAQNQIDIAATLEAAGAARILGQAEQLTVECLAQAIDGLIAEPESLARTGERAAALCDGLGVSRVVQALGAP